MIEVFDTTAARIALGRRMLGCPACDQPLRPWGHARERTIRDLGGALLTIRPDRALCTGCGVSHVMLDAGLLPRRAYAAGLIGQALVASVLGHGHRPIAAGLAVPAGTARGWIRRPRRSRLAPARRQQLPPKVCFESGTSPTWTGTCPTRPPEMPGSSSAS